MEKNQSKLTPKNKRVKLFFPTFHFRYFAISVIYECCIEESAKEDVHKTNIEKVPARVATTTTKKRQSFLICRLTVSTLEVFRFGCLWYQQWKKNKPKAKKMGKFTGKKCRLLSMMVLTGFFFFVEIIVGYITNSMALVADSFHMLGDIAALIISFLSVKVRSNNSNK